MLDANQAAILKVFGVKMATLRLKLLCAWHAEGESFEELAEDDDSGEEEEDDGDATITEVEV